MRFFEFDINPANASIDKFVVALRNHIGRASSKQSPSKLSWSALSHMSKANGFEFNADYETFKSMYDSSPVIQQMVRSFNDTGIELKVPGSPEDRHSDGTKDSEEEVAKIAASAAPNQLSQNQQGIQV